MGWKNPLHLLHEHWVPQCETTPRSNVRHWESSMVWRSSMGRPFTMRTNHRPLTKIFGPKTDIPSMAAARMQRWALVLSGYQCNIENIPSKENANADMLSKQPIDKPDSASPDEIASVCMLTFKWIVGSLTADSGSYTQGHYLGQSLWSHSAWEMTRWRIVSILCSKGGTIPWRWMHRFGQESCHFVDIHWTSGSWVCTQCTRDLWGWSPCPKFHVVAGYRQWHWRNGKKLIRMFTAEKCPTRHTSQSMALGHGREYMWTLPHLSVHGPGPWQRVHVDFAAPLSPWPWVIRPWQTVHVDFAAPLSPWPWVMAESTCGLCRTSQSMALGHPAMANSTCGLCRTSQYMALGHGREYMWTLPHLSVHGPGPSGHGREYMMTLPKRTEICFWLWQIVTQNGLRSSFWTAPQQEARWQSCENCLLRMDSLNRSFLS